MSKMKRYIDVQPFSNYSTEFAEYTYLNMLDPTYPEQCSEIVDGDVFHLGNLDVECIFTPGHSPGHMAFYCASENVCFTGDAMNVDTHLKSMSRQGMVDYVRLMKAGGSTQTMSNWRPSRRRSASRPRASPCRVSASQPTEAALRRA